MVRSTKGAAGRDRRGPQARGKGPHRQRAEDCLDPLAPASAQRSLCRGGEAQGLSQPRGLQARRDRRQIISPARHDRGRSRRRARRLSQSPRSGSTNGRKGRVIAVDLSRLSRASASSISRSTSATRRRRCDPRALDGGPQMWCVGHALAGDGTRPPTIAHHGPRRPPRCRKRLAPGGASSPRC